MDKVVHFCCDGGMDRSCRHQVTTLSPSAFTHAIALLMGLLLTASPARGQFDFDGPPIQYSSAPVSTQLTRLEEQIARGEGKLEFEGKQGYLRSLLKQLDVPVSSQVLVFSKTSLQARRISPGTPRALYFNDETYVGWIPGGDVIEVMSTDALQGEIFHTLDTLKADRPVFHRDQDNCLSCHATVRTQRVPGALVRSVFPDASGQPQLASGSFVTDHRSPFEERWGGWYVTGTHGAMRHMGNQILGEGQGRADFDREPGANLTTLEGRLDLSRYLSPHSDIVALMVLEHQTQMHNALTLASYEARLTQHYDKTMNAALERPEDHVSDISRRRVRSAGEKLVEYLLFAGEFALTSPVAGTSTFAADYTARGLRDSRGRSLRDFDLKTRLFRYPCSPLIYSEAFDRLPANVRGEVVARLREILTGKDESKAFEHLTAADRQAIVEILTETKPGLWKEAPKGEKAISED